jgi:hypothetical protein
MNVVRALKMAHPQAFVMHVRQVVDEVFAKAASVGGLFH